jgi:hypothetical protein
VKVVGDNGIDAVVRDAHIPKALNVAMPERNVAARIPEPVPVPVQMLARSLGSVKRGLLDLSVVVSAWWRRGGFVCGVSVFVGARVE